ncbi:tRNA (N(6)-L-threonylcarbamoyladenosine(37)-C(2))-methylthiotransferase MtaB [Dongia rigui]|uniref:tRNA (N(6)-L-threonylcarbamoyladenosine(37)-C(2))-methylthiotransferase MtaB n=1 Tax=Dongia rigui TaxID=940149 RepID=A0ABU5E504_9PROT|nr:tRNA (N(6)-L-threonylcarbamoyladenosine(37)-C(2))-methylthiotransferase MtaB [Dongia rigui]MDY0873961.1 tRNA (N(6)-L-threonylcarbamoyladenosine(37)-C(2))-methylthiotransferase MtaB [Dongia rigui]
MAETIRAEEEILAPVEEARRPGEPQLVTFGCRLNAFESEVMRNHASAAGLGDAIIFNTCAVTSEAERQARQAIRKARRLNPEARIIVTGCAAQISPETYAAMAEVDAVLGNEEKLKAESFAALSLSREPVVRVADIMTVTETAPHLISGFAARARAFVEIQQGCDHRCTFCIIPFGRGNSRSVAVGAIVEQIRALVANGVREVVLTGVDITSYGGDLPGKPSLGALTRRILNLVPDLPRLRLSSLDVVEVDDELKRIIVSEERLMPHLHLSLQAGDDMILKRMKRRHSRDDAVRFVREMKAMRPDLVFGADLIAGFPTETEAMFENSLHLIDDCDLTFLHVFPYSARKGTPAAKMPQVPGNIRKERAQVLRARGLARQKAYFARLLGAPARVLVEKSEDGRAFGHSDHFAPVALSFGVPPGTIIETRINGATDEHLTATAA